MRSARPISIFFCVLALLTLGVAPGLEAPALADRNKGIRLAIQASKLYERAQKGIPGAEKAEIYAEVQTLIDTILREHNDSPPAMAFEDSKIYAGIDPNEIESFLESWRATNPDWRPGQQQAKKDGDDAGPDDGRSQGDGKRTKDPPPQTDDGKGTRSADDKADEPDQGRSGTQVVVIPMPIPRGDSVTPGPGPKEDPGMSQKELVQLLKEATVFLIVNPELEQGTMSWSSGSGFFIGPDLVATNQHVVEAQSDIVYAVSKDMGVKRGRYVTGTNMMGGQGLDVAIIKLENYRSPTYLRFARSFSIAQDLVISGFPGIANDNDKGHSDLMQFVLQRLKGNKVPYHDGLAPAVKYSFGKLQSHYQNRSGYEVIQHGVQTAKGNSGSPVVNTCGEVIGIHAIGDPGGKSDRGTKYNYAYSVHEVVKFLAKKNVAHQNAGKDCDS